MVAVAQLVESQIVILVVVGSNPIGHPTPHLRRCNQLRHLDSDLASSAKFFTLSAACLKKRI